MHPTQTSKSSFYCNWPLLTKQPGKRKQCKSPWEVAGKGSRRDSSLLAVATLRGLGRLGEGLEDSPASIGGLLGPGHPQKYNVGTPQYVYSKAGLGRPGPSFWIKQTSLSLAKSGSPKRNGSGWCFVESRQKEKSAGSQH